MLSASDTPRWRGINHLALVTPDMDATVRFYAGVLGMRLVATTRAGPMRHYFFEMGPENTVAFFEIKGIGTFAKPAGAPPSGASAPRWSTTASCAPSTSPTRAASLSKRRGGRSTRQVDLRTTATSASSRTRSRCRPSTSFVVTARCSRHPSPDSRARRSSTRCDDSRLARQRRSAKNSVMSAAHSPARTPSMTVASWLRRGSAARL